MIKKFLYLFQERHNLNDSLPLHKSIVAKYNKTRLLQNKQVFCKAPFISFNIKPNGIIGVCNVNTSYVYGKYPERSLKEIWNGQEINKLRNCMQNYDLSQGCVFCHKYVEDRNLETIHSKNYDYYDIGEERPSLILFENSHHCNLNCLMCFVTIDYKNSFDEIDVYNDSFLDELKEFIPYLKDAVFHGGEPFLIPIYYKIWNLIIQLNPSCRITIITNGTVLNDNVRNILESGKFHLNISLDSLDKRNYESIRKGANFDKTIVNLNYFMQYMEKFKIPLVITTCVMQQNWYDIIGIINYCNKNNIIFNYSSVFFPKNCSVWNSSIGLLEKIIKTYKSIYLPQNNGIQETNCNTFTALLQQIIQWKKNLKRNTQLLDLLAKLPKNDLENLLNKNILHLSESFNLSHVEKNDYENRIYAYIKTFKDGNDQHKSMMEIISTPLYILNESLKFENGFILLFGENKS
jgi:MoaA/NifB/PqqE/SkfB family radical SAM enzyme